MPADSDEPFDLSQLPRYQQGKRTDAEQHYEPGDCLRPVDADARFAAGMIAVERKRSRESLSPSESGLAGLDSGPPPGRGYRTWSPATKMHPARRRGAALSEGDDA